MPSTKPNTVILKYPGERFLKSYVAGGQITPGKVCRINVEGEIVVNNIAKANTATVIAVESPITGGIIDTVYLEDDTVNCLPLAKGAELYAFLAPNTENVVKGDLLTFDNAGNFRKISRYDIGADELTGVIDGTLVDVGNINLAITTGGGNTYSDAEVNKAVNTAVNTAIAQINLQLKEIASKIEGMYDGVIVAVALENVNTGLTASRIKVVII